METQGFCALYSDSGRHLGVSRRAGGKVNPHCLTQVEASQCLSAQALYAEFNRRFAKPAGVKERRSGSAGAKIWIWCFRCSPNVWWARTNCPAAEPVPAIGKTPFRNTVAGCTVTIREHLDGRLSVR